MSNNIFNIRAAEAGLAWIQANPNASGVAIDDAALAYCRLDPARRHFQQACHGWQFIHPWNYTLSYGGVSGTLGKANSWHEAITKLGEALRKAEGNGKKVVAWKIYDRFDVCIADMTTT